MKDKIEGDLSRPAHKDVVMKEGPATEKEAFEEHVNQTLMHKSINLITDQKYQKRECHCSLTSSGIP